MRKHPKVSSGFNILKIKIELVMQAAHVFDPLKVEFNFHFNFSLSRENIGERDLLKGYLSHHAIAKTRDFNNQEVYITSEYQTCHTVR
jgi:hypothetical protein